MKFDQAHLPSGHHGPITEPIGDGAARFHGDRLPGGEFVPDGHGRDFIARYAIEAHGWLDHPQSNGAWAFADEILTRYPAITHDEHSMIVDIIATVAATVPDPHDWDAVGTGLDMLWLFGRWQ